MAKRLLMICNCLACRQQQHSHQQRNRSLSSNSSSKILEEKCLLSNQLSSSNQPVGQTHSLLANPHKAAKLVLQAEHLLLLLLLLAVLVASGSSPRS
jgi:hypothetical protein